MNARRQPTGTRDVLTDEMRELRGITRAIVDVLDAAGYGEVRAPTLELEDPSFANGLVPRSPYRLIDEHGETLVLRSDMTVPIARIAASRYASVEPPLKFSYMARAWRTVARGSGEAREFMQAGAELLGGDPIDGQVEILSVLGEVLDAAGLRDWRIGLGDSSLINSLLESAGAKAGLMAAVGEALQDGDFVRLDRELQGLDGCDSIAAMARRRVSANELQATVSQLDIAGGKAALSGLAGLVELLPERIRDRSIIDFGLTPKVGYYGGIVFEVYDPAFGRPIGSGGRYDRLMELAGRPMTAIGFSLDVELVHAAIAGEQRGEGRSDG